MKINLAVTIFLAVLVATPCVAAADKKSKSVEFLSSDKAGAADLPFSDAVRVGNLLFLSGQIGIDPEAGKLVMGGIEAEAKQALTNIKHSLTRHGYAMSDVVKCTVMLADIADWPTFNQVYVSFFKKPYPARSAFAASGLALGSRVEVECIAAADR